MVKARNQRGQWSKHLKRAGQSFDLAVTAVTMESMGETPLCHLVEVSVEGEGEGEWDEEERRRQQRGWMQMSLLREL